MKKIGEFAKLFNVSIKTIRFYEEKGLLKPYYVDLYTSYRYYDKKNEIEMKKILYLKKLGLSLDEIKNYSEKVIDTKIKEFEMQIKNLDENIDILKSLSKKGGIDKMNIFENDERVIGKWNLVGICAEKEDYYSNKFIEDNSYIIKELYLMEEGKQYWVISWSKDYIYINGRPNAYTLDNDIMFVKVTGIFDDAEYKYAIYKKENNLKYTIEDIATKDNINLPFEKDEKLVGNWKAVDFVFNKEQFTPGKKYYEYDLAIDKMSAYDDGSILVSFNGGKTKQTKYTVGVIINLCLENTACNYSYIEENNKTYIIVEWKNGDYVYGKTISGYYVLEKLSN